MGRFAARLVCRALPRSPRIRTATSGASHPRVERNRSGHFAGGLPFEKNCIDRASRWVFADGSYLLTCSAEDLIVHKAFADRPLDWVDIERVIMRQGTALNTRQILRELRPLAELQEQPDLVTRLQDLMEKRRRL
jgi:hypothetical protein